MKQTEKRYIHRLSFLAAFTFFLITACGGGTETVTEEVVLPTEGLITVLQEVEKDLFKIEDEQTIPDTSQSLVVAKYMDASIDTFTLAEVRLMSQTQTGGRSSGIAQAASFGLMGYFMGRSMARRPQASAYTDPKAHQRVNQKAGSRMQQTAARTTRTRPVSGKSGYGSGRSTRSSGG
ncbi:MAG: hypothetical protein AB8B69_24045 [Chitinophagales bacterium]